MTGREYRRKEGCPGIRVSEKKSERNGEDKDHEGTTEGENG